MAWKPDYCTLAELRGFLGVPADKTDDDLLLALDITAASRSIDDHCNRQFGKLDTAAQRTYAFEWSGESDRWLLVVDDFMTDAGLAVEVDGQAVAGAVAYPRNAAGDGEPWTRLLLPAGYAMPYLDDPEATVTAVWGWSAVPAPVKLATLMQASRFAARRDSPYGVAGSPDLGNELRLLSKVDPDVPVIAAKFVRPRRPR